MCGCYAWEPGFSRQKLLRSSVVVHSCNCSTWSWRQKDSFFFFFFRILRHCSQVSEAVLELTEQTSCLSILDVGATSVSHHIQRWGLPISTVGKKQLGYGKGSLGRTTQTVQLYISSFIFSLGKGRCRLVWSGMSTHSVNTF